MKYLAILIFLFMFLGCEQTDYQPLQDVQLRNAGMPTSIDNEKLMDKSDEYEWVAMYDVVEVKDCPPEYVCPPQWVFRKMHKFWKYALWADDIGYFD